MPESISKDFEGLQPLIHSFMATPCICPHIHLLFGPAMLGEWRPDVIVLSAITLVCLKHFILGQNYNETLTGNCDVICATSKRTIYPYNMPSDYADPHFIPQSPTFELVREESLVISLLDFQVSSINCDQRIISNIAQESVVPNNLRAK